ncbi:hypothetical protein V1L54_27390 [Streptomyces sp. TRM 70361]|uniref:hypothetical protein n=1 Tax=Streptomyces sp. TRM 70361 TaxID=3116553 RepID=UPI002E7BB889|nr:hypothetical protein [Streptomyces sp. TRM 70361]MEE1943086.1 hypothetical protein [Streptomyces sp. TRM 70361]
MVVDDVDQEQELVLADLTRDQVRDWRVRAMKDLQLVFDHIDRYGETSARRMFTGRLVEQVQQVTGLAHLNLGYIPVGAGTSGDETSGVELARVIAAANESAGRTVWCAP